MPAGIVRLARFEQPANALRPMLKTDSGMTSRVRPSQSQNASMPIDVTLRGSVRFVIPLWENA
jgi:hypothetical protein